MKLFVDDLRSAPNGWHKASTNDEAIRLLSTVSVDEISLDHDIASVNTETGMPTGETFRPVARYLRLMQDSGKEIPKVWFHTGNISCGIIMADIIGCRFERPPFMENK